MSEEQSSNKIDYQQLFKKIIDGVHLEKLIYDTFDNTFKKIKLRQSTDVSTVNFAKFKIKDINKVREQDKEVTRHYNEIFNNVMEERNKQQGEK